MEAQKYCKEENSDEEDDTRKQLIKLDKREEGRKKGKNKIGNVSKWGAITTRWRYWSWMKI